MSSAIRVLGGMEHPGDLSVDEQAFSLELTHFGIQEIPTLLLD